MTPDHSALIERLEAMGRSHRAHESGLRKRLAAGDRSLSVQDPDNAARSAVTCKQAAAALRDMQRFMPPISFDGPNVPNDHRLWLARQLLDSKLSDDEAFSIVQSFPSAPDQAKALK